MAEDPKRMTDRDLKNNYPGNEEVQKEVKRRVEAGIWTYPDKEEGNGYRTPLWDEIQ